MPIIESTATMVITVGFLAVLGSSGSEKRRNPYVPIFSSTLARITDPAVGASVCASGSHVWNGNIGTFTAKPTKNAQKTHHWMLLASGVAIRSEISKLGEPKCWKYSVKIPRNISTLPIDV